MLGLTFIIIFISIILLTAVICGLFVYRKILKKSGYSIKKTREKLVLKVNIIISYFLGCFALISSLLVKLQLNWLGFPDGSITTLERAEEKFLPVFMWTSLYFGLLFFFLPWLLQKKYSRKVLYIAICIYVLFLIIIGAIEFYYVYILKLENGTGG